MEEKKIILEDSFEFEGKAMNVVMYLFIIILLIGGLVNLFLYPYPVNFIILLFIILGIFIVWLVFHKMMEWTEENGRFIISENQIEITIPSKTTIIIPWENIVHIRVVRVDNYRGDTSDISYILKVKERTKPHRIALHEGNFHLEKIKQFLNCLQDFARKMGVTFSGARKIYRITKTQKEDIDLDRESIF